MYSGRRSAPLSAAGFPIRTSPGQRSVGISPEHFAATHVLHRLLAPRHPPHALSSLQTSIFSELETIDRGPGPCSSQQTRFESHKSSRFISVKPLRTLNKIEFYPSYALVKERAGSPPNESGAGATRPQPHHSTRRPRRRRESVFFCRRPSPGHRASCAGSGKILSAPRRQCDGLIASTTIAKKYFPSYVYAIRAVPFIRAGRRRWMSPFVTPSGGLFRLAARGRRRSQ